MNDHLCVETIRWLRGLFLSCLLLWVADAGAGEQRREPLRVVILHGTHMLLPGSVVQEKAVRETLTAGSSRPIEFYSESFDTGRASSPDYESLFVTLLQEKFRRQKPDLIMAVQIQAFGFISRHRARLWPDVPVVFFGVGDLGRAPRSPRGVTGVTTTLSPVATVQLALQLQPEVRRIYVVGGAGPMDLAWIPYLRNALRPFEDRLTTTFLTNRTLPGICEEVRRLPPDSIVLFTSLFRDASGRATVPRDACLEVSKASAVPVYGLSDTLMGYGIVGGVMGSLEENAHRAGEVGLRILAGEKPENISVLPWPPAVPTVDWRELKRRGISESRLPSGSLIQFREPGIWERHRGPIIAAVAIGLALLAWIVALWINWAKRRRSERTLDQRLRFERLVSELSAMFINLPLESVDQEVARALEKVRVAMDLDHTRLFTVPAGGKVLEVLHHAEAPGITPLPYRIEESLLPWVFQRLCEGGTVLLENALRDLPADAAGERAFVAQHGLRSVLVMPVRVTRESVHGICMHTTRRTQPWPETLTSRLHLIGEILSAALAEKQAELALRASEERYRGIVEDQTELICRFLPDGTFTFVNDAYCRYFQKSREDLIGRTFWQFIPPEAHEASRMFLASITPEHPAAMLEHGVWGSNGEVRWQQWRDRGFFDEQGRVFEFQAVGRDITDRKRAEDALRDSEERYREVVESQTDMVCRYLPDTTLTFVNEAYCRCFNGRREELIGRKFSELLSGNSRGAMLEHVAAVARSLATATHEHELRLPDGTIGWHQWTTHAVVGPDGQAIEFQGIGRDISDRKRAEAANRSLARASRLAVMGELTATIGHEINQPLTAILSNSESAQLLLNSASPPLDEVRQVLADIRADSLRAGSVIQHIRSLLQERRGEAQILDLNEIAGDVVRFIEADALHRGVKLQTRFAPDLPGVQGDRVHLQQALLNLLLNGMDAMSETPEADRRLTISTTCNGDHAVKLSVADRGHGVAADRMAQIFDSFFTTKKDGMGLGLSIARTIVQAHAGKIWGENNAAGGMTFAFTLPIGNGNDRSGQRVRVE